MSHRPQTSPAQIRDLPKRLAAFARVGLWCRPSSQASPMTRGGIGLARVLVLTVRKFIQDNCTLHASALTFYSLLSVVPLAAMAFGIAKGFGFQKRLQVLLLDRFPGQEQVLVQIIDAAGRFLESTKGGLIAGIGLVVLFWTVV